MLLRLRLCVAQRRSASAAHEASHSGSFSRLVSRRSMRRARSACGRLKTSRPQEPLLKWTYGASEFVVEGATLDRAVDLRTMRRPAGGLPPPRDERSAALAAAQDTRLDLRPGRPGSWIEAVGLKPPIKLRALLRRKRKPSQGTWAMLVPYVTNELKALRNRELKNVGKSNGLHGLNVPLRPPTSNSTHESPNGSLQWPHADGSARGREELELARLLIARGRALYLSRLAAWVVLGGWQALRELLH